MAQLQTLHVSGAAAGDQAAAAANEFVRKGEVDQLISGTAARSHRHAAGDVDGLIPLLLGVLEETLADSATVAWSGDGTQLTGANVRVQDGGGLRIVEEEGLAVDPTAVSQPGHSHAAGDVVGLAATLYARLKLILANSDTVRFTFDDADGSGAGNVRLQPAGALVADADGLGVDLGSGTQQAARGDHTHAGMHAPVTIQPSDSLQILLNGQNISLEVLLASLGGLRVSGGVGVDWGSGTNQVPRGNHSHAELHAPVTVASGNSVSMSVDENQTIRAAVNLDAAPGAGQGRVGLTSGGLVVELGVDSDQAAAGDHGHSVATVAAAGFMSAQDKQRVDGLWAGSGTATASGTLPGSGTMNILQVQRLRFVNVTTGQTRDVYLGNDGLMMGLTP